MDTDIVIAGGGLNGTALAVALAQAGHRVALVDPHPAETRAAPDFDGRAYALNAGSCNLLRALGIWATLRDGAQPILDIVVTDGRAGEGPSPLHLAFDHAEIEEGPMGHMVEDRHLRPALLDAVAAAGVDHRAGRSVTDHAPDAGGVAVSLDDGTMLRARLLVGCDGKGSAAARRAGIGRMGAAYGQSALVAAIAHEKPHHGVAHQFFMPEGPLAILPLTDDRANIVWTERTDRARHLTALDDDSYLALLRPRFGDFLGDIALAGQRGTWPLELSLARALTGPRLALAGDAAHVVHPIAGQGLNAGLKDAATLAEVLTDAARRGEDIGADATLDRYARWRRFDIAQLALATDTFNRLFSNDNPLLRAARDIGLGLANATPGLRRAFIREAAGLTGDRPRLLSGRTL